MQLIDGADGETIAWLRILENIVVMANVSNLERATGGEWFATLCRSLVCILRMPGSEYGSS